MDDEDFDGLQEQIDGLQAQLDQANRTVHDLSSHNLALLHVTQNLWSQFLGNSGDPIGNLNEMERTSLDSLEEGYQRPEASADGEHYHLTLQSVLHHEESFWRGVRQILERK